MPTAGARHRCEMQGGHAHGRGGDARGAAGGMPAGTGPGQEPAAARAPEAILRRVTAAILTIGNELVSGDVPNTNAAWLAQRLEQLGVRVVLSASVPDTLDLIVDFVRRERSRRPTDRDRWARGTPDDITRESLAAAFDVPQRVLPELAADLRGAVPGRTRVRRTLGGAAAGRRAARESARRRTRASGSRTSGCCPGCRARWRRCSSATPRSSAAASADRRLAAVLSHRRGDDRLGPRHRHRALARCQRRLVPQLRAARAPRRGRAQIGRRRRAQSGQRLARRRGRAPDLTANVAGRCPSPSPRPTSPT